ncbi:hypothetical protein ACFL4G_02985 [Thermodesulfobacteriota bacterium]
MKRTKAFLLCLAALPILLGMGALGGAPPTEAPATDDLFSATVTDAAGVTVRVSRVSVDGWTSVTGHLGNGVVTVPFGRIESIDVEPGDARRRGCVLKLTDGETVKLEIDGSLTFIGSIEYGTYRIRIGDVATIRFTAHQDSTD